MFLSQESESINEIRADILRPYFSLVSRYTLKLAFLFLRFTPDRLPRGAFEYLI